MRIGIIERMDSRCKILEELFYTRIPLTKSLGLRVTQYADGNLLVLAAPLKPNINIHGTAFAGSVYSVAALAGWGLLYLKLTDENLSGDIVIVKGGIVYSIPVRDKIEARCRFSDQSQFKRFRDTFSKKGKARIHLRSEVLSGSVVAASYDGDYFVSDEG